MKGNVWQNKFSDSGPCFGKKESSMLSKKMRTEINSSSDIMLYGNSNRQLIRRLLMNDGDGSKNEFDFKRSFLLIASPFYGALQWVLGNQRVIIPGAFLNFLDAKRSKRDGRI